MHDEPKTIYRVTRGILSGAAAGGIAFLFCLATWPVPTKVHAWLLLALAGLAAISETHFRSLMSELSSLLRRGTYSVWQLEQLDQDIPKWRSRVTFAWNTSLVIKLIITLVCAFLIGDVVSPALRAIGVFAGYSLLFYSGVLAVWAIRSFRKLERQLDALTVAEASMREKRRLQKDLSTGGSHDFEKDELAKGYTKPPLII